MMVKSGGTWIWLVRRSHNGWSEDLAVIWLWPHVLHSVGQAQNFHGSLDDTDNVDTAWGVFQLHITMTLQVLSSLLQYYTSKPINASTFAFVWLNNDSTGGNQILNPDVYGVVEFVKNKMDFETFETIADFRNKTRQSGSVVSWIC